VTDSCYTVANATMLMLQLIFSNFKILNRSTNCFLQAHWVTVS